MEQQNKNIYLIGFMGAGKSIIARYLHNNYAMDVVEIDQVIEQREGMPISAIFETQGEEYFRKLETDLLLELQTRKNLVVSCGGGTPLRACNVEAMKKNGMVVFLTATPETVFERVKDSHNRPVIEKNKNVSFIASLMEQRRDKYEAAADLMVATDGRSAEEICQELMQAMNAAP
jgi:shikimate kinase